MEYRIGCSGWSYSAWQGHFYPNKLPNSKWLEYYSKVFDYVEIDSTFYSTPSLFRVKKWAVNTPKNFRFTVKMPKVITHEKAFYNIDKELDYFYSSLSPLKGKNLAFLIQMPPSISFKAFPAFKNFCNILDTRYRYAIDARQTSWFNDEFYAFLMERDICLVWNEFDSMRAPPVITTDFVYVRLIGDRSIDEKDFGRIQKDREAETAYWVSGVRQANVPLAIVAANNHYAGFGPESANGFRRMVGLDEVVWDERKQSHLPF